ncbi:nucleotide exchange factor GrpE [Pelobium manganitolerans]|uniref:Protein GrpE n=2 Tax=Pelobium manganitolerans TaxID=1842495 RepID=A0A419S3G3_9SPHI|nr:nucleotide exchange factor GrpE [Pelobium manganitolerans]RKD13835.1 nucleotide exchange factor GrpE [Pelobium manganitolerans]
MFNRKKVSETEENNKMAEHNEEAQDRDELKEEIEQVNEARVNQAEEAELDENEKLKNEVAQLNDKYVRLYAEFDNYKRRTTKERIDLLQTAGKDVIVSLLGVLDDFERASKVMETATDVKGVKEGVDLIHNKLQSLLSQKGLKAMEAIGQPFDADVHEAITNVPAPSPDLKGKVIDEVEKGYFLNDKVIRFAKVVVGA